MPEIFFCTNLDTLYQGITSVSQVITVRHSVFLSSLNTVDMLNGVNDVMLSLP